MHIFLKELIGVAQITVPGRASDDYDTAEAAHENHPRTDLMYEHSGIVVSPHRSEMVSAGKQLLQQKMHKSINKDGRVRSFKTRATTNIGIFGKIRHRATSVVHTPQNLQGEIIADDPPGRVKHEE